MAKYRALDAAGRVVPAGAKAFSHRTEAKSAVYSYEQETVAAFSAPGMKAFKRNRQALQFLEATPPSYRKTIIHWVTGAKKAEARSNRFATLLEACAAGQWLR
ncbi:MAG TPA: YdeI/OmpD-associated family protein [Hydrogenophaga sp.]|nr:YdeI/OmpD-associated family protein [Hydrogenophaga sp.]